VSERRLTTALPATVHLTVHSSVGAAARTAPPAAVRGSSRVTPSATERSRRRGLPPKSTYDDAVVGTGPERLSRRRSIAGRGAIGLLAVALAAAMLACRIGPPPGAGEVAPSAFSGHYRAFPSGDSLAAYLREGSAAGVLVSANRGGPAPGYPENAIATFEHALQAGPVLVECDVRLSRDGVPMLLHDATLDRTTTGTGRASDSTTAALRRLSLRDPYGAVTEHHIPTLDEALAWAKGRTVLELDVQDVPAERVVAAVRSAGAETRVVVIVDDLDELLRYHRLAPGLVLSASHDADGRSVASRAEAEALLGSGVDASRLLVVAGAGAYDRDAVAYLGARGVRAIVGTLGEIDHRARAEGATAYCPLIADGVDVIATDVVPVAVEAAATCRR